MFVGISLHGIGNDNPVPVLIKRRKAQLKFRNRVGSENEHRVVPKAFQPRLLRMTTPTIRGAEGAAVVGAELPGGETSLGRTWWF